MRPVHIPGVWAVLDGLLAVLAPPVSVLEVVDLALGHEREPRLPLPLLALALGLPRRRRPASKRRPAASAPRSISRPIPSPAGRVSGKRSIGAGDFVHTTIASRSNAVVGLASSAGARANQRR